MGNRDLHLLCLNRQQPSSPGQPGPLWPRGRQGSRSRRGPTEAAGLWEPCPRPSAPGQSSSGSRSRHPGRPAAPGAAAASPGGPSAAPAAAAPRVGPAPRCAATAAGGAALLTPRAASGPEPPGAAPRASQSRPEPPGAAPALRPISVSPSLYTGTGRQRISHGNGALCN